MIARMTTADWIVFYVCLAFVAVGLFAEWSLRRDKRQGRKPRDGRGVFYGNQREG